MTYCVKKHSKSSLKYQTDASQAQFGKSQANFDYQAKRNDYSQSLSRRLSRKDFHMKHEQIAEDTDTDEDEANDEDFNDVDFENDFNDFQLNFMISIDLFCEFI